MSLGRKLAGGLKDLKEAGGGRSGGAIEAHDGTCRAKAQVREFDKLAVLLDELEVWTTAPGPVAEQGVQVLEAQAGRIEKKIDYLIENFKTYEFDRSGRVLQMRSAKPFSDGPERRYFELILTGGFKAVLRRYKGSDIDPGRQSVPISMTMDVLERFVDDLSAIIADRRA